MYKVCSRCGQVHDINKTCYKTGAKRDTEERKLRSTYKWTKKSKEIREDSMHLCAYCLSRGIYTFTDISVHHIVPLKEDREMFLSENNLIALCDSCHKKAEAGLIKRDELFSLVKKRMNTYISAH